MNGPTLMPKLGKRKKQRIILEHYLALQGLLREPFSQFKFVDTFDIVPVWAAVYVGRRMTAHEIAEATGLTRSTVQRRLDLLAGADFIVRTGRHYLIAESKAAKRVCDRRVVTLILETAKGLQ